MRRHRVAAAVLVAALAGFMAARAWALDQPRHHVSPEMEKCLAECARCTRECESCMTHCTFLVGEGKKEHVHTLRTCNDCGDMCALAGKLIARDGVFMNAMCEACAKACDGCGSECAKFPHDEHMTKCAKACRDCARACRDMIREGD